MTTAAGLYVLAPLAPGEYTLKVTAVGFQTATREHIVVEALATIGMNVEMKVGSSSEQVTVEAEATALRTEDVVLGQTMQNNVYNSLPLAMGGGFGGGVPRDPTQFIALAPGVAAVVTQSAGPSYTSFNGAQQETNGLYLEGMNLTFANQQGDTRPLALGVSVEAIEQFQVEVNGQKAQYQGQGFHNYQLKSGTNQFHGAAYEYFRNTTLDARGFFSAFVSSGPPERVRRQPRRPHQKEQSLLFRKLHRLLLQHRHRADLHFRAPAGGAKRRFHRFRAYLRPEHAGLQRRNLLQNGFPEQHDSRRPHFGGGKIVSVVSTHTDKRQHHEQLSGEPSSRDPQQQHNRQSGRESQR